LDVDVSSSRGIRQFDIGSRNLFVELIVLIARFIPMLADEFNSGLLLALKS